MSNQADIRDIQILGDLKAAFGRFGEDVLQVLAALEKQFEEIQQRLEERQSYWGTQVDQARDTLHEARHEMHKCHRRAERARDDDYVDCSFEEDQVSEAEKEVAKCEENWETVKKWRHRIESQIADFENDLHRLSNLASSRTSSAQAFLANKIEILERYVGVSSSAPVGLHVQDGIVTIKLGASETGKPPWIQSLQGLLAEYTTAPTNQLPALRERARVALEVPKSDRNKLTMTVLSSDINTNEIARQGADIVERFVSSGLLKNVKIQIYSTDCWRSSHSEGRVYLGPRAERESALHEIMHAVEQQNPQVLKAATEFLFVRGQEQAPVNLSDLTDEYYDLGEKAFEDKWKARNGSVYAGKIYPKTKHADPIEPSHLRATEVLTMGIERLFADPLEFYQNDPEWLSFVVNTLQ